VHEITTGGGRGPATADLARKARSRPQAVPGDPTRLRPAGRFNCGTGRGSVRGRGRTGQIDQFIRDQNDSDGPERGSPYQLGPVFRSHLQLHTCPKISLELHTKFDRTVLFPAQSHTIDDEEDFLALQCVEELYQLQVVSRKFRLNRDRP